MFKKNEKTSNNLTISILKEKKIQKLIETEKENEKKIGTKIREKKGKKKKKKIKDIEIIVIETKNTKNSTIKNNLIKEKNINEYE